MVARFTVIALLACLFISVFAASKPPELGSGKLLGKYTFRAPFLFGTVTSIPFWNYGGSTVATENFIRLVPAIRSRVGWVWTTEPVTVSDWEVTIEFNIHNTHSPGADGMAFWYAKKPAKIGSLFGYVEDFSGVGVVFDSYDNNGNGDNPSVIAIKNDGQFVPWDYDNDLQSNQLDRCRADFRNPLGTNTKAKIMYYHKTLYVLMDTHGTGQYVNCITVPNLELPTGYYFGLTGATGGLADYHDVYSFETRDLNPEFDQPAAPTPKGRRGWYDPYKNAQAPSGQTQPAGEEKPADESAFLATLKEKLKKYGIDDTTVPTTDPPASDTQAPAAGTPESDRPRKRIPLRPKTQPAQPAQPAQPTQPAQPSPATAAPVSTEVPSSTPAQAAPSVTMPTDYMTQKAGILIVEALEGLTRQVNNVATKTDILSIATKVDRIDENQQTAQNTISEVREHIRQEVSNMMSNLKHETTALSEEIKRLDSMLNTLYLQVDNIQNTQGRFVKDFERNSDDVKQTIKKESSFGFWIFFILFQLVFTGLLIYWKKYRDQANKGRYLD